MSYTTSMHSNSASVWPVVVTALLGFAGVWLTQRQGSKNMATQLQHDDRARTEAFAQQHAQRLIEQRRIAYENVLVTMDELNFSNADRGELDLEAFQSFIKGIERARLIASSEVVPHLEALFRAVGPMLRTNYRDAIDAIAAAREGFIEAARKDLSV